MPRLSRQTGSVPTADRPPHLSRLTGPDGLGVPRETQMAAEGDRCELRPAWGQALTGTVCIARAPLDFAAMQAHCREAGLMAQKIPEQLEVVDALPRNATLKILKHVLRERFTREEQEGR